MATKSAVIVLCEEAVLIWAIPSLLPQPPDFFDRNPTHIPPLFTIPFPDGIPKLIQWKTICPWYLDSSQPLYFDMLSQDLKKKKLHKFKIMLKPDLSTASLHVMKTSEYNHHDFDFANSEDRICEDTLVTLGTYDDYPSRQPRAGNQYRCSLSVSTSTCFANVKMLIPNGFNVFQPSGFQSVYFCPASGRFVVVGNRNVAVLDVF
jgi:hypothetical protein